MNEETKFSQKYMKTINDLKSELDVPFLIANEHGFITFVNDHFKEVFGWTSNDIVGKTISTIIPKSYHDAHHLSFSRFAVTEKPTVLNHPLKLVAVTKDGREIESEHFITAEQIEGKWFFGATLRPIGK